MTHIDNHSQTGAWSDEHSEYYIEQWGELLLHRKIPELCNLSPSDTVLDIGCGSGAAVRAIAHQLTTGHVMGIDPTPKMLEIAHQLTATSKYAQAITWQLAGAEHIPIDDNSCDLVLAINTLHHWGDINGGINEVWRVLKSKGRFITIDDLWEESNEYAQAEVLHDKDAVNEYSLKTRNGIVTLLNHSGFSNITNNEHREPGATASIITGYKI